MHKALIDLAVSAIADMPLAEKVAALNEARGYPDGIPDESDIKLENAGKAPSWRRICKTLLRNDYWCKYLGFSPTKTSAYQKYTDLMARRRAKWGIFNEDASCVALAEK